MEVENSAGNPKTRVFITVSTTHDCDWIWINYISFWILGRFSLKSYSYIWKLSRDDCGMVQNIFKSHFGLGYSLKNQFWTPKLKFSIFQNLQFSVFVHNSLFQSQNSRSILQNMFIMTTRTILVFGKKRPGYGKTLPKKSKLGKMTF